ncbi:hypothetical protein [Streptomyces sp. NPDC050564]|uniref:hypothetical protein n=1 Tax=Streptomyces sp. NPDC050564 TaxID=3365631 RepID=UPI0037A243A3
MTARIPLVSAPASALAAALAELRAVPVTASPVVDAPTEPEGCCTGDRRGYQWHQRTGNLPACQASAEAAAAYMREYAARAVGTPRKQRERGKSLADHEHGHPRTYAKGCRCDACRAANAQRCASQRAARAQDSTSADRAGHGKASTYKNHGCRCTACSKANTAAVTDFKRRKRALVEAVAR